MSLLLLSFILSALGAVSFTFLDLRGQEKKRALFLERLFYYLSCFAAANLVGFVSVWVCSYFFYPCLLSSICFAVLDSRQSKKLGRLYFERFLYYLSCFLIANLVGLLSVWICTYQNHQGVIPFFNLGGWVPKAYPFVCLLNWIMGLVAVLQIRKMKRLSNTIHSSYEKIKELEKNRTDLLKSLAHDVRSPITTMGFILEDLNEEEGIKPEILDRSKNAMFELSYLQRLLENQLLVAQWEDPQYEANELIGIQALLLEMTARQEGVELILRQGQLEEKYFQGNRLLMNRIIRNLLDNARRFAKSKVEIEVGESRKGGIEIVIRDDGDGFSPEGLAKFGKQKHLRAVDPSLSSEKSVGLGTYIVCSTMERMGGKAIARNRQDKKGGEVVLSLPKRVLDTKGKNIFQSFPDFRSHFNRTGLMKVGSLMVGVAVVKLGLIVMGMTSGTQRNYSSLPTPISKYCAEDFKILCKDITPGSGKLKACMTEQKEKLSERCRTAILGHL